MAYKRFKRIEVHCSKNFSLGIDNDCSAGCWIFSLGWFGFTILGKECQ